MGEICASGSVGGEGGNILAYPASCPFRAINISPTGNPPARGMGSEIAHKSKKFTIPVLPASKAVLAIKPSGVVLSDSKGATIFVVGTSAVRSCQGAVARCRASHATAESLSASRATPIAMTGQNAPIKMLVRVIMQRARQTSPEPPAWRTPRAEAHRLAAIVFAYGHD
jgi:hypothetical protein